MGKLVAMESKENLDLMVEMVNKEHPVHKEIKDFKVNLDPKELLDQLYVHITQPESFMI